MYINVFLKRFEIGNRVFLQQKQSVSTAETECFQL